MTPYYKVVLPGEDGRPSDVEFDWTDFNTYSDFC